MDVVPGNVQYAGVAEVVRCFWRRGLDHRFANIIGQTIDDAPGAGEETAAAAMVMLSRLRERRERRAPRSNGRSNASTAGGARIGGCIAGGKDKHDAR